MFERIYGKDGDTLLKPKEEIIRCRECKYCELNFIWSCKYHNGAIKLDDFCSFAERKEQ